MHVHACVGVSTHTHTHPPSNNIILKALIVNIQMCSGFVLYMFLTLIPYALLNVPNLFSTCSLILSQMCWANCPQCIPNLIFIETMGKQI